MMKKIYKAITTRLTRILLFLVSILKTPWITGSRRVFLFGAPFHYNLGDHAQTFCIEEWVRSEYPDRKFVTYDTNSATMFRYLAIRLIGFIARGDDIIFLHSGYHTTDLYPMENNLQKKVVSAFPGNKIVILPQTINYTTDIEQESVSKIFNNHSDLTILCRDDQSYETAEKIFQDCSLLLFPDVVTSRIGFHEFENVSDGINLCMRNDKESLYKRTGLYDELMDRLGQIDKTDATDTESSLNPLYIRLNLKRVVFDSWGDFGKYKVTVTDRYHGTIFSLIAGTPVVVLASTDHKLKSGVKWFPKNLFKDHVYYAESVDEAVDFVKKIYKANPGRELPKYFAEEYYGKLASKLTD